MLRIELIFWDYYKRSHHYIKISGKQYEFRSSCNLYFQKILKGFVGDSHISNKLHSLFNSGNFPRKRPWQCLKLSLYSTQQISLGIIPGKVCYCKSLSVQFMKALREAFVVEYIYCKVEGSKSGLTRVDSAIDATCQYSTN